MSPRKPFFTFPSCVENKFSSYRSSLQYLMISGFCSCGWAFSYRRHRLINSVLFPANIGPRYNDWSHSQRWKCRLNGRLTNYKFNVAILIWISTKGRTIMHQSSIKTLSTKFLWREKNWTSNTEQGTKHSLLSLWQVLNPFHRLASSYLHTVYVIMSWTERRVTEMCDIIQIAGLLERGLLSDSALNERN